MPMSSYSAKQKSLAIIPKFTGGLSFLGSAYIFQDVIRSGKKRRKSVYHRLILGLSTFDLMASAMNILSTWPIPRGTPGVFGAVGTTGTCSAQGFFNEVGNVCTPVYNAALCAYFLCSIKNGWSEHRIRRMEGRFHFVPQLFGWTLGTLGLVFELYNNSGWLCWFAPLPSNCHQTEAGCLRGEYAHVFRWVHYAIVWSAILFVTVGMLLIYGEVRSKEKATRRFTQSSARTSEIGEGHCGGRARQRQKTKSRRVAQQAMLFVGALYLTWIFTTLTRIFQITQGKTYYPLLVLMAIFFPLQGFFNALIYLRPRYLRFRADHPDLSLCRLIIQVVTASNGEGGDADMSFFSTISSTATRRISLILSSQPIRRLSTMNASNKDRMSSLGRFSSSSDERSDDSCGVSSEKEFVGAEEARATKCESYMDHKGGNSSLSSAEKASDGDRILNENGEARRSTSVTWACDVTIHDSDANNRE